MKTKCAFKKGDRVRMSGRGGREINIGPGPRSRDIGEVVEVWDRPRRVLARFPKHAGPRGGPYIYRPEWLEKA